MIFAATSCGGGDSNSASKENTNEDQFETETTTEMDMTYSESVESGESASDGVNRGEKAGTTPMSSEDFMVVPLYTSVGGPLNGYVEVVDKEYNFKEYSRFGDGYYGLPVDFSVVKTVTLPEEKIYVTLYIKFYDANRKLVHFSQMTREGDPSTASANDKF